MQNLINFKSQEQKTELKHNELTLNEIEKFYLSNFTSDLKIGLEYERLSLDKNTLYNAPYEKVAKIIEHFSSFQNWELRYDADTIIGAKDKKGTSISLEPGCQLELSLAPKKNIIDIDTCASEILNLLDKISAIYDVIFLGYGISPKSATDDIKLLDKRRYQIMYKYLPYCTKGELCPKMMKQTAGIQINLDYKNKIDAYNKLKLFNLIMPFISGLCANSPIENDSLSDYKSLRSNVWRFSGENRCNLFYKNIFFAKFLKHKNIFRNYIDELLNVPMVFIERDDNLIPINGKITFKDFLKSGFGEYKPRYSDYITHQSLCFPDVRLKNYIEIRNHDSNSFEFALALCALYKGICLGDINLLLKKINYLKLDKIDEYYKLSSINGINFEVEKTQAIDVISQIYSFSASNLDSKERSYLEPILNLLKLKKTTADIIVDNNIENARSLVEFL